MEADGSLRFAVADVDPGACNWLETRGQRGGTMQFRLSRAGDLPIPSFETRVVQRSEVAASQGCRPLDAVVRAR